MNHDNYAALVSIELRRHFKKNIKLIFGDDTPKSEVTILSNHVSGRKWPIPDGRISVDADGIKFEIAIEFKTKNEGRHGILTSIGQALAYIDKGYDASIIIVPERYDTFDSPGPYIENLLDSVNENSNVLVVTYSEPDNSHNYPFEGKLSFFRKLSLNTECVAQNKSSNLDRNRSSSQWMHLLINNRLNDHLKVFNNPDSKKTKDLFLEFFGIDITESWVWGNYHTAIEARTALNSWLKKRGEAVHRAQIDKQSVHIVKRDELDKCIRFFKELVDVTDSKLMEL